MLLATWIVVPVQRASAADAEVDGVRVHYNLQYREGGKPCMLDLAAPVAAAPTPRPVIVVIHGGGWIEGDKSSFSTTENRNPASIIDFARLGFVAATINYRLSREAPFPAALDDCRCAVRWLRAHAGQYGIDPNRIGVYGNSAGGHLALLLAMMPPTSAAADEPYAQFSHQVQAAVSDSGPMDLALEHEHNRLRTVIERFMGGPPDETRRETYHRASPVEYPTVTTTPLLLIYGEADGQVDVAIADRLVATMSAAGRQDVSYVRLAKVDHCPHSLVQIPYLRDVVAQFFVRALHADAVK
jgi:acetyl esterase/lipase